MELPASPAVNLNGFPNVVSSGGTRARIHRSGSVDINLGADALRKLRIMHAQERGGETQQRWEHSQSQRRTQSPFQSYGQQPLQKTWPSADAASLGAAAASSSAVVVSAMTALQEKIRVLEADKKHLEEKVNAMEVADASARVMEAKRETELSDRFSAQISALNTAIEEKSASLNAMTTRASCAEETIKALRTEVDYLKERVREIDAARSQSEEKCVHTEHRIRDLERQLADERRKYDEQTHSIKSMEQANVAMLENAERARQKLAVGIKKEHELRNEAEERCSKAEDMLRNVVELNEGLVAKLSALAEMEHHNPAASRLHAAHTSSSFAKSRRAKQGRAKGKRRIKKKNRQNVHEELVRANRGRPVPFLLSKSAGPSFSVYGQVQSGIHPDEAYGGSSSNRNERSRIYDDEPFSPSIIKILSGHGNGDGASETNAHSMAPPKTPTMQKPPSRGRTPQRKNGDGDISSVMESMQIELNDLKDEYTKLLSHASVDAHFDKTQLARLIDAMDAKSQHIHLLKRYQESTQNAKPRSPVRSPGAYNKKIKQLRLLRQFRAGEDENATNAAESY